jgi:succinate dehydrogenase/fumarate reductase cytochrome b subunit
MTATFLVFVLAIAMAVWFLKSAGFTNKLVTFMTTTFGCILATAMILVGLIVNFPITCVVILGIWIFFNNKKKTENQTKEKETEDEHK